MGYIYKPQQTAADVQQVFTSIYNILPTSYGFFLAMDAVLSDDADCSASSSYCPFDNFTITPSTTQIQSAFLSTYSQLGQLNRILNDVPNITTLSDAQKTDFIAQARGRDYPIYSTPSLDGVPFF